MLEKIERAISEVAEQLFSVNVSNTVSRTDEQFGEYSSNVAFQLAGKTGNKPPEIAEKLADALKTRLGDDVSAITVVNNFINFRMSDTELLGAALKAASYRSNKYSGKIVVAEYSDPNPFKVLHAGHFYTSVVGDSVANLLETAGAEVHRVNFGGDVGLHVAKTLWSILYTTTDGHVEDGEKALAAVKALESKDLTERSNWLAEQYVMGTTDYEEDTNGAKQVITDLNKQVYDFHKNDDHDSTLAQIYWLCRQWSYDYFEHFYTEIGVHPFEKYYPESQTVHLALKTVNEQLEKGVYQKSDGAVVFDGEKYGLHTRVFINSAGLPTYEAKDVGLILLKWQDYHYDLSLVITANEQLEYMKVVLKSVEQFEPKLAKATTHLTHGLVKLKGGEKMSSRKGNILRAADVLQATAEANKNLIGTENKETTLGAIKYAFLKQRLGADVIYDPTESVSLVGNSGPYLQYAHARARSILAKAPEGEDKTTEDLMEAERSLVRKISEFPEVIDKAVTELMSHYLCTYLYELSQVFNSFYEDNRVLNDPRQAFRLQLVSAYADTLKAGLNLLSIPSPDHL